MAVRVQLSSLERSVRPLINMPPQTITIQPPKTGHAEQYYGQHNFLHGFSRPFHFCHMCFTSVLNSGIHWQMPIELHSAGSEHWAL